MRDSTIKRTVPRHEDAGPGRLATGPRAAGLPSSDLLGDRSARVALSGRFRHEAASARATGDGSGITRTLTDPLGRRCLGRCLRVLRGHEAATLGTAADRPWHGSHCPFRAAPTRGTNRPLGLERSTGVGSLSTPHEPATLELRNPHLTSGHCVLSRVVFTLRCADVSRWVTRRHYMLWLDLPNRPTYWESGRPSCR